MYKLFAPNQILGIIPNSVLRETDYAHIPFASDNSDYIRFVIHVRDRGIELKDHEGNVLTQEQVLEKLSTMPPIPEGISTMMF